MPLSLSVTEILMPDDEYSQAASTKAQKPQQDALWQPQEIGERVLGIPSSYILYVAFFFSLFFFSLPGSSGLGSASSIQAAVRQLEAEADAIIQMVREGQRARRQQQAATVSMMPVAPHSFVFPPPPTMSSVGFHCPYLVCFCIKFAIWMLLDSRVIFCWCFPLLFVDWFIGLVWNLVWFKAWPSYPLPAIHSVVALLQTA